MKIKYWVNGTEGETDNFDALPPSCDKVIVYINNWVFEIPENSQYYIAREGRWTLYPEYKFEVIGYHIVYLKDGKLSWMYLKKGQEPQLVWNIYFKEV